MPSAGRFSIVPRHHSALVAEEARPDIVHFLHLKPFSAEAVPELAAEGLPVVFTPTDYWTVCPQATLVRGTGECEGPSDAALCLDCLRPVPRPLARLLLAAGRTPLRRLGGRMAAVGALGCRAGEMARCLNSASAILPATRFLADVLVRHGVDSGKIRVVGYGVRLGELPAAVPIPDRFDEASPLRVGFIGTLSELKGPHVLLESMFLLPDPRGVCLEVYGKAARATGWLDGRILVTSILQVRQPQGSADQVARCAAALLQRTAPASRGC